ncbi:transmembrane protein [Anaeramoeba flamelloides]|uniref:Transmembrane protein n=1 Tax=Anaeramoeba flamelloides TaxID=1746091 RepID=A0AAV7Y4H3_9EUKA|nr:transmembrane protein [Anaeramoeba flamelloides]
MVFNWRDDTEYYATVHDLNRLNEFLYIDVHFSSLLSVDVKTEVDFILKLTATNDYDLPKNKWTELSSSTHTRTVTCEKKSNCSRHTLVYEPYLNYQNYRLDLQVDPKTTREFITNIYIDVFFVRRGMTMFELFFRYVFVMLNIICFTYFVKRVRGYGFRTFDFEQKWVACLLLLLLLFNNPLWPILLLSSSGFVVFLDAFVTTIFFLGIWGFWLCLIDGYRYRPEERTIKKFYLPKFIPLFLLWLFFFIIYIWGQMHEKNDSQYETTNDIPGFITLEIIMFLIFLFYILWVIYACIRVFIEIKEKPDQKKRFYTFFIISAITFILTILVVSGGFVNSLRNTSLEFLATYVIYNSYLLSYSVALLPASKPTDKFSHTELDEDTTDLEESINKESENSDGVALHTHNYMKSEEESEKSSEKYSNSSSSSNETD